MALTKTEFANSNCRVTNSDYEIILSVIMETARGRSFLAEFARRNRHADTQTISSDSFDFKTLLLKQTHS